VSRNDRNRRIVRGNPPGYWRRHAGKDKGATRETRRGGDSSFPTAGGGGPKRESEGLVVPARPVKAGGGKGPWFRVLPKETKSREIGMSLVTPEKIREFQRKLYVKAKGEPGFRFYILYDKIWRRDILAHAYMLARANGGAPGVDGETFVRIEAEGLEGWLDRLREELRSGSYKPGPVRRVYIPKAGGGERPLGIPNVRDRVAQTSAKLVLEPIFEADFEDGMYGYRPQRSAQDAVEKVLEMLRAGHTDVVDADLSKFFDTIPHDDLTKSVARRISDKKVMKLIEMWLKVPVYETNKGGRIEMKGGKKTRVGTPQGGVISPLLANIYMNRLMRVWRESGKDVELEAVVVNYADDFVILTKGRAQEALDRTRRWVGAMKLNLNEKKTRLCDAAIETFDFLGYTFGPLIHNPTGREYLAARPSDKAVGRLREKVRAILSPWNVDEWEAVIAKVNRIVRGWANYFSIGTVARTYWKLSRFIVNRARQFLCRRHKVPGRGTRAFPTEQLFDKWNLLRLKPPERAACPNA